LISLWQYGSFHSYVPVTRDSWVITTGIKSHEDTVGWVTVQQRGGPVATLHLLSRVLSPRPVAPGRIPYPPGPKYLTKRKSRNVVTKPRSQLPRIVATITQGAPLGLQRIWILKPYDQLSSKSTANLPHVLFAVHQPTPSAELRFLHSPPLASARVCHAHFAKQSYSLPTYRHISKHHLGIEPKHLSSKKCEPILM
jgi:hypothetical protein